MLRGPPEGNPKGVQCFAVPNAGLVQANRFCAQFDTLCVKTRAKSGF